MNARATMHSTLHVFDNIIYVCLSSFFCVLSFDAAFVFLQSMDNNTNFCTVASVAFVVLCGAAKLFCSASGTTILNLTVLAGCTYRVCYSLLMSCSTQKRKKGYARSDTKLNIGN